MQDRGREESSGRGWAGGPSVPPKVEKGDGGGEGQETRARCVRLAPAPPRSPFAYPLPLSHGPPFSHVGAWRAARPVARRSNCPQGTELPRPGRDETSSIPNERPCSRSEPPHGAMRASSLLSTQRAARNPRARRAWFSTHLVSAVGFLKWFARPGRTEGLVGERDAWICRGLAIDCPPSQRQNCSIAAAPARRPPDGQVQRALHVRKVSAKKPAQYPADLVLGNGVVGRTKRGT